MSTPNKYENFWRAVGYYGHRPRVTALAIMATLGLTEDLSVEKITWESKMFNWDLMEFSLMGRELDSNRT